MSIHTHQTRPEKRRIERAKSKRSKFLKNAMRFAKRGIPVFPIAENGKNPLTKNGFKDATVDLRQIKRYWKQFPNANIGVPTGGVTGFVVVDLDVKSGIDGVKNFEALCRKIGVDMPDTYTVETPSGGLHFYLRTKHAGKIKNSAGDLAPGIDVRGQGGYVVAEGSSIDGKRYRRVNGVLAAIAKLPTPLRREIKNASKRRRGANGRGDDIPEGERNDRLFREACAFRASGRSQTKVFDIIEQRNLAACKPPLAQKEVEEIVDHAFSYSDEPNQNDAPETITARCAADIKVQPLAPLWPGFLYRRKVALVAGEPGLGKSLMSCDVTARISCASDWPGGESAVIVPANVVMISGEDDPDDTIVPRLIAAGANLSNIHIIDDVVENQDGELSVLSLDQHMPAIHKIMLQHDAVLLVIDPLSAFLGDRDSHRDSSVRALLNKLRRYAIEGQYAVLLITHFNKPGEKTSSAVHRVMGSLGFVAAPRSVYAFLRDPDDPDQRLFLPIKTNLGPDQEGFRCRIAVDRTQKLSPPPVYLKWDDEAVEGQRVDEVMAQATPREKARKAKEQEIREWLDKFVKRGKEIRATKFNKELKRLNYGKRAVRKIMPGLGYHKTQKGFPAKWWVVREKHSDSHQTRR